MEEALVDTKAHWDYLEKSKARKRWIETWYQGQSTLDDCVEEFGHRSVETKRYVANLTSLCVVENLPLHMGTRAGFMKFMRHWEPRWPSISKQSMTRSLEEQSRALRTDIKCEMLEIAAGTDIAFTTNFWTSPTAESFITMSMHWITWNWRLKTCFLGTMHFPKKHTTANIYDRLLNAHINFGVWPKDGEGRIPENEEALRCDKLAYFGMEPPLDRPVLTSDCGSDVSVGAEKNTLWD